MSQKRTDGSGKTTRGWRNGIARLATIALLTTMFFGASAGAASADGLLGGLLGNGNSNEGGGGTTNPSAVW